MMRQILQWLHKFGLKYSCVMCVMRVYLKRFFRVISRSRTVGDIDRTLQSNPWWWGATLSGVRTIQARGWVLPGRERGTSGAAAAAPTRILCGLSDSERRARPGKVRVPE